MAHKGLAKIQQLIEQRKPLRQKALALHNPSIAKPVSVISKAGTDLLSRLTTLQDAQPYSYDSPRGVLFIHWYYRERKVDTLSRCEIFHLNMLRYFNAMNRFESICIRCASTVPYMTNAMSTAVKMLNGKARIDFKLMVPNKGWEHDTFKAAVEYAISTGERVYYVHFKGASRIDDPIFGTKGRGGYNELDVYYWCWLLYKGLFEAPDYAKAIGPLLRAGINKSYTDDTYDLSWAPIETPHHYAGSFQAFDGAYLKARLSALGLQFYGRRLSKIWVNDPYTVEMFLTMMYPMRDVYSMLVIGSLRNYNMYSQGLYKRLRAQFSKWPLCDMPLKINPVKAKYGVLTYMYGGHHILREPKIIEPNTAYICVTDNPRLQAGPNSAWTIIYDPWTGYTGRFTHMQAKFRPFRYIDAERIAVIDSSLQLTGPLRPLFERPNPGILLKAHPLSKTIGEELPRWPKLRHMPQSSADYFKATLPLVQSSSAAKVYELDFSIWSNTDRVRQYGEMVLAYVEGAGAKEPFMSNQLCASALAHKMYSDIIAALPNTLPYIKYRHNTWDSI